MQQTHFTCELTPVAPEPNAGAELEALRRAIVTQFDQYVKLNKKIPAEILTSIAGIDDPGRLADTIAAHLPLKLEQKQKVLEMFGLTERLEHLLAQLETEIDILQVEKRIRGRVKRQMEKSQREYYLNEQVKAIQKELGEGEEGADIEELDRKIKAARMPKQARQKAEAELKKLKLMSPMSAEATVVRNYIDTLIGLPWKKKSKINNDLANAQKVLDEDHYGLEKVKDRIVEYLAVQQRVDRLKAPILCLVGPPGVGKTSLGQSIARATNRKFVRMALGGVRDEAEIRGHRRTYIGSMPGKILQNLTKAGVRNPLYLLDEVDKMGQDFRGDPSSALLEVLDPEQNHTFVDHYVEVDYDLSDVMFVATANTMNIPPPLLDRMEVIRLSGYTEDEKVNIAMRYLLPKQMKQQRGQEGRAGGQRGGGARHHPLLHARGRRARTRARAVQDLPQGGQGFAAEEGRRQDEVAPRNLDKYLGVRRYTFGMAEKEPQVGQVTGLAWTEVGGELLTIEAAVMPGKGNTIRTGSLGDVMKESVEAARSVVRSRARRLGIKDEVFEKTDIHVHMPEGATPKDGPSAGIAVTTALRLGADRHCRPPGRRDDRGDHPARRCAGHRRLKEKLLAALRGGIKTVLIPEDNVKDLAEIPDNVKNRLELVPVKWIDRVLEIALQEHRGRWPTRTASRPTRQVPPVQVPAAAKSSSIERAAARRLSPFL
jgi:ATP-dependent Lon protease